MNNKVIIVGHESSRLNVVEDLLLQAGMKTPKVSKNEAMLPNQITKLIRDAHNVPSSDRILDVKDFSYIEVKPVWQILCLNLMLNNMDKPVWGWSDPNILPVLNFWNNIDHKTTFILVYSSPITMLNNTQGTDDINVDHKIKNWIAYNEILLDFYNKNKKNCILINSEYIESQSEVYLNLLGLRMDSTFGSDAPLQVPEVGFRINHENPTALKRYLSELLIKQYPEAEITYAKLERLFNQIFNKQYFEKLNVQEQSMNLMDLWKAELYRDQLAQQAVGLLKEKELEIETLKTMSVQSEKDVFVLGQKNHQLKNELENQLHYVNTIKNKLESVEQRILVKDQEISKTQHACLSLEHKAQEYQQRISELEKNVTNISEAEINNLKGDYEAKIIKLQSQLAESNDLQLTAQNEVAHVKANNANEKLKFIQQIAQIQAKLEEYHVENQNLRCDNQGISSIGSLPFKSGAANMVKNDLPYKIGQELIQSSKSLEGVLNLPKVLYKNIKKARKYQAKDDIKMYTDSKEAEKVQKHLSYKLGNAIVENSKNPLNLVKLPWILSNQITDFKKR